MSVGTAAVVLSAAFVIPANGLLSVEEHELLLDYDGEAWQLPSAFTSAESRANVSILENVAGGKICLDLTCNAILNCVCSGPQLVSIL